MATPACSTACVGSRFVCEGDYGTVRFVGEVPPTKGVWLGVEWDEPSRGKHSGEHEGVLYFKTQAPGSGSFVRPKKVYLGCSFMEALKNKYGVCEEEEDVVVGGQSVELVGMDKVSKQQSEYNRLIEVSLEGMNICSAGPHGEIKMATPNIRQLSLATCLLLPNWRSVADMISQLMNLESLDISENVQLSIVTEDLKSLSSSFQSLKTLYLNRMKLSWRNVSRIMQAVPRLQSLHVCENNISSLRFNGDGTSFMPEDLQLLNLEKNSLSDWTDLLRLEPQLKKLKTLILNDNQLSSIFLEEKGTTFPELSALSLLQNPLSEWSSVMSLASLPNLVEVKLKDNLFLKGESGFTGRQLIIARLNRVTSLNRSSVSSRERVLAERYYVKRYGPQWIECKSDESAKQAFLQEHPRFYQLMETHGLPDEVLMGQKPVTTALKHGLISVTIKCPDNPDLQTLTKKLPSSMTVQKLKGLLHRVYKVDTSDQKVTYLDKRGDCEIELNDDLKQLSFFSIENGDTVLLRW